MPFIVFENCRSDKARSSICVWIRIPISTFIVMIFLDAGYQKNLDLSIFVAGVSFQSFQEFYILNRPVCSLLPD
jgi:hypothetical protein